MQIESVSKLSPQQVKDIFNDRIIVIIERDPSIDKSLVANRIDLNLNPNLLKTRSQPEELIWIFGWCNLSILAVWKIGKKVFTFITIAIFSSQVMLGGIMIIMGNSTPIAMTSIAIISAGMIGLKLIEN